MIPISVVMPAYNAENTIKDAIDSVLNQSFTDFEFIIVDDGSTDNTVSIINSYKDSRIRLVKNEHDFINTLNTGMQAAKGKYIARMDADDMMYIDRLRIQYAIMEEDSQITVCSSWMTPFGEDIPKGIVSRSVSGFVEHPLLRLLQSNIIFHPTALLRTDFMEQKGLKYEKDYIYAEDFKLWVEVAKRGGVFYVETQSLLYYRVSTEQISETRKEEQEKIAIKIKKESIAYLIELNKDNYPSLFEIEASMQKARKEELLESKDICDLFYTLFMKNKNILNTGINN